MTITPAITPQGQQTTQSMCCSSRIRQKWIKQLGTVPQQPHVQRLQPEQQVTRRLPSGATAGPVGCRTC
jgi:hypothetical protein